TYSKPSHMPYSSYYARPAKFGPVALPSRRIFQKEGYNQFYNREESYSFEENGRTFTQRKALIDYRDYGRKNESGANHIFAPVIDYSQPKVYFSCCAFKALC